MILELPTIYSINPHFIPLENVKIKINVFHPEFFHKILFSIGIHFTANIKLNQIIFASLLLFYERNAYFYTMLISIKCLFIMDNTIFVILIRT